MFEDHLSTPYDDDLREHEWMLETASNEKVFKRRRILSTKKKDVMIKRKRTENRKASMKNPTNKQRK